MGLPNVTSFFPSPSHNPQCRHPNNMFSAKTTHALQYVCYSTKKERQAIWKVLLLYSHGNPVFRMRGNKRGDMGISRHSLPRPPKTQNTRLVNLAHPFCCIRWCKIDLLQPKEEMGEKGGGISKRKSGKGSTNDLPGPTRLTACSKGTLGDEAQGDPHQSVTRLILSSLVPFIQLRARARLGWIVARVECKKGFHFYHPDSSRLGWHETNICRGARAARAPLP